MQLSRFVATVFLAVFAAEVSAGGPVTPNAGSLEGQGSVSGLSEGPAQWAVRGTLKGGNFTGQGTLSLGGTTFTAPLVSGRSYLENGKCYFHFERDRTRVSIGGPCTTDSIAGNLDAFVPGSGVLIGQIKGELRFGSPQAATAKVGALPTSKLTCAWWDTRVTFKAGEVNSRELRFSNMGTLTLSANGTYRTASSSGTFTREGGGVRLKTGAFAGALGQLRPDRSGQPAVYFEREENKRPNGVHIVDPNTTACTVARK